MQYELQIIKIISDMIYEDDHIVDYTTEELNQKFRVRFPYMAKEESETQINIIIDNLLFDFNTELINKLNNIKNETEILIDAGNKNLTIFLMFLSSLNKRLQLRTYTHIYRVYVSVAFCFNRIQNGTFKEGDFVNSLQKNIPLKDNVKELTEYINEIENKIIEIYSQDEIKEFTMALSNDLDNMTDHKKNFYKTICEQIILPSLQENFIKSKLA